MATQQLANIYITNLTGGDAYITLSHNNSTNGTQTQGWDAAPNQTVGPLTVYFETGVGTHFVMDYWWVTAVVRDGPNPGLYASSGAAVSEWKECQLQHEDEGQDLTFTVSTTTFDLVEKSSPCSNSMTKTGSYSPITNVFVLMLENHSFDNIFAMSGIPGIIAANSNINAYNGINYQVESGGLPSMHTDPGHEFLDTLEQLCGAGATYPSGGPYPPINNSGFVSNYATSTTENDGNLPTSAEWGNVMDCFDTPVQLPVIYQLATEFAICDQWFSSIPGPTWPNRFFVHGASSAGWDDSPDTGKMIGWEDALGLEYPKGSIYDALTAAGISWRLYADKLDRYSDSPNDPLNLGATPQVGAIRGIKSGVMVNDLSSFASDLQQPYAYTYTFIEPNYGDLLNSSYMGGSSQHPMDDVYGGENLIKAVYETIRNSPLWNTSLLIIIYDEHGGFYDSVAPGPAVAPGDGITGIDHGFDFTQYGIRVPAVVISPLIPQGTVDHTLYDHSSVLATLERLFNFSALTDRDANANDVRHLLSLPTPRTDCPTQLNPPAPPVALRAPMTADEIAAHDLKPLPTSGNLIGFLHITLKTELELSDGDDAQKQAIVENFKNIKTYGQAKAYHAAVMQKLAVAKASGQVPQN